MSTMNKKLQQHNQLLRLNKEEQQAPLGVFDVFFDCYHLKDLHEVLWDWLLAALGTDSGIYDRGKERSNLIFLYQKLEALVEAAYLLHVKQPEKKTKRKKKK